MSKVLFDGTLTGKVIRAPIGYSMMAGMGGAGLMTTFLIQLKEQIEGIPNEFPVYLKKGKDDYKFFITSCMSVGDLVQVNGKVIKEDIKFWKKEVIWMRAEHVYNENIDFGY